MIEEKYTPHAIESKWQKYWEDNKAFKTDIDLETLKNQCIIQIDEISLPNLAKAIYRQEQVYRFQE